MNTQQVGQTHRSSTYHSETRESTSLHGPGDIGRTGNRPRLHPLHPESEARSRLDRATAPPPGAESTS